MSQVAEMPKTVTMREFMKMAAEAQPALEDESEFERSCLKRRDSEPRTLTMREFLKLAMQAAASPEQPEPLPAKSSCSGCSESPLSDEDSEASTDVGSALLEEWDRADTLQSARPSVILCDEAPQLTAEFVTRVSLGAGSDDQLRSARLSMISNRCVGSPLTSERLSLLKGADSDSESNMRARLRLMERYEEERQMMERVRLLLPAAFPHIDEVRWEEAPAPAQVQ